MLMPPQDTFVTDETTINDLPPELAQLASFLEALPDPIEGVFRYYVCLLMVEAGKMRLIGIVPGKGRNIYVFETLAGGRFNVVKPAINQELETDLIEELRELLNEDEL
jgi:hypothetical protein